MGSGLIDVAMMVVVAIGVFFLAFVATANTDGALQHVALVCSLIVVFLVYPTTDGDPDPRQVVSASSVLGLRVVRDDGGTVTAQQSFVRALIGIVEIYALLGGPAFFCCLVSSRGKRIGDYAAGTYVVRDRVSLALPPPPPMPSAARLVGRHGRPGHPAGRADPGDPAVPRPAPDPRPRSRDRLGRDAGDPAVGVRRATTAAGHHALGLPGRGQRRPPRARPRPAPPRRDAAGPVDRALTASAPSLGQPPRAGAAEDRAAEREHHDHEHQPTGEQRGRDDAEDPADVRLVSPPHAPPGGVDLGTTRLPMTQANGPIEPHTTIPRMPRHEHGDRLRVLRWRGYAG